MEGSTSISAIASQSALKSSFSFIDADEDDSLVSLLSVLTRLPGLVHEVHPIESRSWYPLRGGRTSPAYQDRSLVKRLWMVKYSCRLIVVQKLVGLPGVEPGTRRL